MLTHEINNTKGTYMNENSKVNVIKRDGTKEQLDLDKIHKILTWACEEVSGVSISEIELKSELQLFDDISTKEIHKTLTKTAADLISEEYPNYQYVAAKLLNFNLRKEVFGTIDPWPVKKLVEHNIAIGYYTEELMEWYSDEEWSRMNKIIKHDRDYNFSYAGMKQMLGKYLCQNRVTGEYYETPQMAYLLIAATLFHDYPSETRMGYIKDYYDALSNWDISVPTPILAGVRTPTKQFSSCVLISSEDSLDSINATASSIVNYVSRKAGIGINAGRIRAIGSEIRKGEIKHTGVIPFLKYFHAALKSCSQGGVRGGAATVYYPFFHYEFENLIVLKNNKGVDENRIRHMDYGVQLNRLAYKRLIEGGKITFFSPHEVPDLMDAFYSGDNDNFERLYEKYERSRKVKMKYSLPAIEVFSDIIDERTSTGRIYIQNIDHCNNQSSFDQTKHPIEQSNLCCEITLPTKPFSSLTDESGRIALCTLSAINWGNIRKPEDFEKPCNLAVRALDELLSYQKYPMIQAELSTQEFRTLGVGIINLAYFIAKNNMKYDHSAFSKIDEYMEAMSFYLIKASVELAKEKGPCELWKETKYGQGRFPWENRKKDVDNLIEMRPQMDWESLREDMKKNGIRNATLMALMPSESSSQLANATNGVEPPRALVSEKSSKDGVLKQVVPEIHRLKNKYDLLWDQKSPDGYLDIMCIIGKYVDQAISTNVSINPENYPDNKIPMQELIKQLLTYYKNGGKLLYYHNTYDGATDSFENESSDENSEKDKGEIIEEEECDSCVL